MAQLLVRMDDNLKKEADRLFSELGMTTQTAVNVFLREALRTRGIPFDVTLDPFFSKTNTAALKNSIKQAEKGEYVVKTLEELKAMENGD